MQKEFSTDLKDDVCDLLFYQYIIKTSTGTYLENMEDSTENSDEDVKNFSQQNVMSQNSVYAYEKYKELLRRVLSLVQKNDTVLQETSDEQAVQEALTQLQIIERDVLMVEKATLIKIGKASGMHTVAQKLDMLQRTLLKSRKKSSRNKIKRQSKNKTKKSIDSDSDGYVSLEDKSVEENDMGSSEEVLEQDVVQSDDNNSIDISDLDEEETDKIIPIEGPLPKAFIANNDIKQSSERINNSTSPTGKGIEELIGNSEPIDYFHKTKEWGWLSSFHPGLFYYKDRRYRTVEHAFHAQKSDDVKYQGPFSIDSPVYIGDSALAAKHRGSKKSFESSSFILRKDWDDVRVQIMRECVEAFYAAHPALGERLVKTLPAPLHHTGYKVGTFWGMQKGKGENQHGKILMALRDKLSKKRFDSKDVETKTSTRS